MYGLGIMGGFLITLKNLFRTPFTIQYPEEEIPRASRFRGEEFVWYEQRCTGCASCAKYCPLGIIKIETSLGGTNMQEGQSYSVDTFDIDIGRCCLLYTSPSPRD